MSGDPERMLGALSNTDPLERELLGSVRHVGPPDGAKEQAWRAIAGQIAVAAAVGVTAGSSSAAVGKASGGTFASWALGTKLVASLAVSSLVVGGGYLALRTPEGPPVSRVESGEQTSPSPRATAPLAPPPVVEATPPVPAPAEEAPSKKSEPRRLDLLKAESAAITEARAQLRSGNVAGAQATLDRLQAQLPKGTLMQEREVLAIEVQHARGNVEAAGRRAQAFIKAYPKSPHSQKLTRFVK
jgi:hypothetical protein